MVRFYGPRLVGSLVPWSPFPRRLFLRQDCAQVVTSPHAPGGGCWWSRSGEMSISLGPERRGRSNEEVGAVQGRPFFRRTPLQQAAQQGVVSCGKAFLSLLGYPGCLVFTFLLFFFFCVSTFMFWLTTLMSLLNALEEICPREAKALVGLGKRIYFRVCVMYLWSAFERP